MTLEPREPWQDECPPDPGPAPDRCQVCDERPVEVWRALMCQECYDRIGVALREGKL